MECLKIQLDFHSSWEVINNWMSRCWELVPFGSGQFLLCVPVSTSVCLWFRWTLAMAMADVLLNVQSYVYGEPMHWIRAHNLSFLRQEPCRFRGACPQACTGCGFLLWLQPPWSSWLCLRSCISLGNTKHESMGIRALWQDEGNRLQVVWRLEKLFSVAVATSVPRSAEELGMMLRGGSCHGFILYVCPCEKSVFDKQILKHLVCSFCLICKSCRGNWIYAYLAFKSCQRLMMLQCGCVNPRCSFLCHISDQVCGNHPGVC